MAPVLGPAIDEALAGGVLRGAVVELASRAGRARATSIAIGACVAAQREAERFGSTALCAWIDPTRTLYGPGVRAQGIDLSRLFFVAPEVALLSRVAVRVAESRAFAVVVVDAGKLPSLDRLPTVVRRLALAVEGTSCSVLLLTDLDARRSMPLPTAARIELSRTERDAITLRVAKDRHGRIASPTRVSLPS
jgi:recombination protein RecA